MAKPLQGALLGGSWVVIHGVISRVTTIISHFKGLITLPRVAAAPVPEMQIETYPEPAPSASPAPHPARGVGVRACGLGFWV